MCVCVYACVCVCVCAYVWVSICVSDIMRGDTDKESSNNMTGMNEDIDDEEDVAEDIPDF